VNSIEKKLAKLIVMMLLNLIFTLGLVSFFSAVIGVLIFGMYVDPVKVAIASGVFGPFFAAIHLARLQFLERRGEYDGED
jgi:hypothetical protein